MGAASEALTDRSGHSATRLLNRYFVPERERVDPLAITDVVLVVPRSGRPKWTIPKWSRAPQPGLESGTTLPIPANEWLLLRGVSSSLLAARSTRPSGTAALNGSGESIRCWPTLTSPTGS